MATRGWILNFKKRYGLRPLKICGEKLLNNVSAVELFITQLSRTIRKWGLRSAQTFNVDESGLFWKILPYKTHPKRR